MSSIHEELGTKIITNCDTTGLEQMKGFFNDLDSRVDDIISAFKEKEEIITQEVALTLQSNEQQFIQARHFVTGRMMNSVNIEQNGNTAIVGASAVSDEGFPYPLAIEFGRREVVPVNAKVLRWVQDGMTIFAKQSGAVAPDPFVDMSITQTLSQVENIVNQQLGGF